VTSGADDPKNHNPEAITSTTESASVASVLLAFTKLGLTSFGGPIAHIGYFRREFVDRRGWISEMEFADLVALCQFLPGPASSQVGFAIGLRQAGLPGGLAAFVGFTAPSAVLMLAAAQGLALLAGHTGAAIVHGLLLVAVSIVAQAVYGMARTLCPDRLTSLLAVAAFAVLLITQAPLAQPAVIFGGAFAGLAVRSQPASPPIVAPSVRTGAHYSFVWFGLFLILLIGLPVAAELTMWPSIVVADAFYRSGALVFGGGHVILPLLQAETVGHHWLDQSTFLAGYGAAQALPGPLSTFAAYLGAASDTGLPPLTGGVIAMLAVFLPGFLLVAAALPVWRAVKQKPWAFGLVRGANASVVGVLAAALYSPIATSAILRPADMAIAGAGFVALQVFRAPSWLVVIGVGMAGVISALA
jgi:chromate transporter